MGACIKFASFSSDKGTIAQDTILAIVVWLSIGQSKGFLLQILHLLHLPALERDNVHLQLNFQLWIDILLERCSGDDVSDILYIEGADGLH